MPVSDFTALLPEWYDPNGGINYGRHNGLAPIGNVTFISYSFLAPAELPENSVVFGAMTQYTALDAMRQASIRAAISEFEEVAGVRFVEVDDPAHAMMTFQGNIGNNWSWAYFPYSSDWGTDPAAVTLSDYAPYGTDPYAPDDWARGGSMFTLTLHEIGHAMGLDHPHEGRILDPALDSMDYTVMSYNWNWSGSGSPDMLRSLDIDALRHLYGPETAVPGDWSWSWNEAEDRFSLTGGGQADVLLAIDAPSMVQGGLGNDRLYGRDHGDTLDGGAGADTLIGGQGHDSYLVDSYADQVTEIWNGGIDTIRTSLSSYSIFGQTLIENLTGTRATGHVLTGNGLANVITGHMGDDRLVGGAGNDTLQGSAGKDTLDGGSGSNSLAGGSGDDTYVVSSFADVLTEAAGAGIDTVQTALGAYSIFTKANIENITSTTSASVTLTGNSLNNGLTGNSGNDTLVASSGNDTLRGMGGNDRLDGGAGQDVMIGGQGNDTYLVDSFSDVVTEQAGGGTDTIVTSTVAYSIFARTHIENLTGTHGQGTTLTGNSAANRITAGQGHDSLLGGAGHDTLDGGANSDTLNGGSGADVFQFSAAIGGGTLDHIRDFDPAEDMIHLLASVFAGIGPKGGLAATAFHIGTAASTAAHRVIYNAATGDLFHDADGAGGEGQIRFARLDGLPGLTAADLLVI
ncbi:M10 family metallopeptidase [Gemmobacter denitrificans]|uniref:Serralysin n=1 Tax=Gemmobacter denitrificans TaxID=3123040 RepID=A0ABU8C0H0_9RHOB